MKLPCNSVTNASAFVSVEVVAVLSDNFFSRCSVIFNEILFFMCFILGKSCSQLYVLPKSDGVNEANYEAKDTFPW